MCKAGTDLLHAAAEGAECADSDRRAGRLGPYVRTDDTSDGDDTRRLRGDTVPVFVDGESGTGGRPWRSSRGSKEQAPPQKLSIAAAVEVLELLCLANFEETQIFPDDSNRASLPLAWPLHSSPVTAPLSPTRALVAAIRRRRG